MFLKIPFDIDRTNTVMCGILFTTSREIINRLKKYIDARGSTFQSFGEIKITKFSLLNEQNISRDDSDLFYSLKEVQNNKFRFFDDCKKQWAKMNIETQKLYWYSSVLALNGNVMQPINEEPIVLYNGEVFGPPDLQDTIFIHSLIQNACEKSKNNLFLSSIEIFDKRKQCFIPFKRYNTCNFSQNSLTKLQKKQDHFIYTKILKSFQINEQDPLFYKTYKIKRNSDALVEKSAARNDILNLTNKNIDEYHQYKYKNIYDFHPFQIFPNFNILNKIFEGIIYECEFSLGFVYKNFLYFFKDQIGRKSFGFSFEADFHLASSNFSIEIDPGYFYAYDILEKSLYRTKKLVMFNSLCFYNPISQFVDINKRIESNVMHRDCIATIKDLKNIHNHLNEFQEIKKSSCSSIINSYLNEEMELDKFPISNKNTRGILYFDVNSHLAKLSIKSTSITLNNVDYDFSKLQYKLGDDINVFSRILLQILMNVSKPKIPDRDVCIFFSGGVDSLLIACIIIENINKKNSLFLINTSIDHTKKSKDRILGRKAYKKLIDKYPDYKILFIENDIRKTDYLDNLNAIKDLCYPKTSKMDINIGACLYFSAKKASEFSKIVFSGSGADELFCGYKNHFDETDLKTRILTDLKNIFERNLGRDDRVIGFHDIELRHIFLDTSVIRFVLGMPECFFIKNNENKVILRKILYDLGFEELSTSKKLAMQFGSGLFKYEKMIQEIDVSK